MTDLPKKPRYGITEAAYYLDVSDSTVRRLIDHGKLDAEKIGKLIKIPIRSLEKFIENSKIDPFE